MKLQFSAAVTITIFLWVPPFFTTVINTDYYSSERYCHVNAANADLKLEVAYTMSIF